MAHMTTEQEQNQIENTIATLITRLREARDATSVWKREADRLREEILELMGDSKEVVNGAGVLLASVRESVRMTVNRKKLEAKYPDVYQDVVEEKTSTTLSTEDLG